MKIYTKFIFSILINQAFMLIANDHSTLLMSNLIRWKIVSIILDMEKQSGNLKNTNLTHQEEMEALKYINRNMDKYLTKNYPKIKSSKQKYLYSYQDTHLNYKRHKR